MCPLTSSGCRDCCSGFSPRNIYPSIIAAWVPLEPSSADAPGVPLPLFPLHPCSLGGTGVLLVFVNEEADIQIREHCAANKGSGTAVTMVITTVIVTIVIVEHLPGAARWEAVCLHRDRVMAAKYGRGR